jgi:hypothetical protein
LVHWRRAFAVVLTLISVGGLLAPRGGRAVPLYAARTGLQCGTCHFDPNGGGPRNEFGFTFARNRHSLEPEDSTSTWRDLAVVNRVGENAPLYFGVNQRFMLIANDTETIGGLDRLGFFNMENALHLTLQPHAHLTLVYTRDGFDDGSKTQEAFGMIGGGPWSSYFKAGRIRTPFGLRMDDHTVATRNSFLDFSSRSSFLPYDPRSPDMGVETGFEMGPLFGRVAFTNGRSHPFAGSSTRAEAKTAKLGFWDRGQQFGLSFYDDFRRGVTVGDRRATRWGLYGLSPLGPTQVLGEIAAGTDVAVTGEKNNLLAGFIELDYAPCRWLNFRGRFDHLQLVRGTDAVIRDLNLYHRYALEGEVLPVPFAELRWTLRWIDPRSSLLDDEAQAYLQFHFSY